MSIFLDFDQLFEFFFSLSVKFLKLIYFFLEAGLQNRSLYNQLLK